MLAVTLARTVGVDIERVRHFAEAEWIVRQYFSQAETVEFFALPARLRTVAFFTGWTRKEAYLKALGGGWGNAPDGFDVTVSPDRPPRLLRAPGMDAEEPWSLYQIDTKPGYLGAIAIPGFNHRVAYFDGFETDMLC
ncbi:MAG: 4'-phosphopantetheinyl transferase superfamily protein [Planctomycetaceae bacterium]|nr:4'-phosphopantetheinyl transferase superfamily protein [Planctomycetaceae bacterium]